MATILILAEPVSYDRMRAVAAKLGLDLVADPPHTHHTRFAAWRGDRGRATWLCRSGSPHPVLFVDEGDGAGLAAALEGELALVSLSDLTARVAAAEGAVARIHAAADLSVLFSLRAGPERDAALTALGPLLLDDARPVRYAAAAMVGDVVDRKAEALLAAAAEKHADLLPALEMVREACAAEEDGTLYDGPTDDPWELRRRAQAGLEAGRWKRVAKAAGALLKRQGNDAWGLYFRGLAHEAAGERILALMDLAAAEAELALTLSIRAEDGEDEKAEVRELLATVEQRAGVLTEGLRSEEPARLAALREGVVERLVSWWRKGERQMLAMSAARALLAGSRPGGPAGLDVDLSPLLTFMLGSYHGDREKLEQALALAPDSPAVALRLAQVLGATDKAASYAAYERILARMRAGEGGALSPAAALIARAREAPSSLDKVLESLAVAAYDAGERVRAIELADELVKVDPDSTRGWIVRGHARLFELRYADAAEAYAEGIREVTRIRAAAEREGSRFFGDDPRASMHYNRACALGRLGKKEEALDALRHAVRLSDKYAEKAKTEEWIECLWGSPELEAIVRKDPRALVTAEERDPSYVARLTRRGAGRFYRGEAAEAVMDGERALELATVIGDAALEVSAIQALAYALALSGQAGRAVELCARAVALADAPTARVPVDLRAEAYATQGTALIQHGDIAGAERAHLRALELRREAYGEGSPLLAKSYGDLARVQELQGKPAAEVRGTVERAVAQVQRFLDAHPAHDDDWAEAIGDLCTLQVNQAQLLATERDVAASISALETAATSFEVMGAERTLNTPLVDNARQLADRLADTASEADHAARARAVSERLLALRHPGASPAARREHLFFDRLRRFVARMRREGVSDEALAEGFQRAVRGADNLPEALRDVPELASFAGEFARRAAAYPTFLVTGTMALQTASADFDEALESLEGLCVAMAMEAEAG